jgi:hypothetical protein
MGQSEDPVELGAHQFISHVTEDAKDVARLQNDLERLGLSPWVARTRMDDKGGRRWREIIRDAIRDGHAFIACFSQAATARDRSYMNEELLVAIDELRLRPRDRTWFVPIRFNECRVPELSIGPGETLLDLHRIDLFPEWLAGVYRIAASLGYGDSEVERWIIDTVKLFDSESEVDRRSWFELLRNTRHTGHCRVRVGSSHYSAAQRLCRCGAFEADGWRNSYAKFNLTDRGRLLLAALTRRQGS